jgi:YidC/Oxa1 family membrane protein insertase
MGIFFEILTRPLLNVLIVIYNLIPDFGVAIILFTILIRLILFPLNQKALKSQREMAELQPKLLKVKEEFKDDKQKQAEETMKIYKDHKINPFAGIFAILIQLPIFIALFQVLRTDFAKDTLTSLYDFIPDPGVINQSLFGLVDLAKASVVIAVLAGITQFIQAKLTSKWTPIPKTKGNNIGAMLQKNMLYFFPVLTFMIALSFPAGLSLYWTTSNVFGVIQQWYMSKPKLEHKHGVSN